MWRILLIALLFYLIIWIIRGLVSPRAGSEVTIDEEELVSDSLTGVFFPKNKAVRLTKEGQTFYFISIANRDLWLHQKGLHKNDR
jgi:hypothetical protein